MIQWPGIRRPGAQGLGMCALGVSLLVGCGARQSDRSGSHVVYAIPDDFRLSMLRFARRLEANDIEGTLRSFDALACPGYRDLERVYLEFARRANDVHWEWRITDVKELAAYRQFEVVWTMSFDDVLHGHRVVRRGVTDFRWSHHVVPRIVGLERDALFVTK